MIAIQAEGSTASPQMVKAAKNAAKSPHGLINLIRLVNSLESRSVDLINNDYDGSTDFATAKQLQKDADSAAYARVLLDTLREGNERSSSTASTLQNLDKTLSSLQRQYDTALSPVSHLHLFTPLTKSISRQATPLNPLVKTTSRQSAPSSRPRTPLGPSQQNHTPHGASHLNTSTTIPDKSQSGTIRKRNRNAQPLDQYLRARAEEDRQAGEVGLIPLRTRPAVTERSARDQLLSQAGGGMGAAQLHEKLGGQLADMSHRLKLNAVHFSNSLEAEKALLESSQNTLENNLTNTRSSKKHLSTVSRKGRGTTCMTLGVVVLVMVIFVWTYMLIRFT